MTKKVTGKDLQKLIEEAMSEDLAINFKDTKVGTIRKALGFDSSNSSIVNKNTAKRILKTPEEKTFDVADAESFTTKQLDADSVLVQKDLAKAGDKQIANSPENRALMHAFLNKTVWDQMSEDEKKDFSEKYFHLKNWGLLKQLPVFASSHPDAYNELLKQFQAAFEPQSVTQQVVDDPSITSPNIQTALGDKAAMTQEQKNYFDRFFQMNNTGNELSSRLQALTNFSTIIAGAEEKEYQINALKGRYTNEGSLDTMKLSQNFIVNIGVLDMFNNFAKNIDFGAGAYFFETFLAYLAGGQAGGKTSGVAGGMGEADFLKADGTKGSAKYMQKGAETKQSWKNFVEGFPVEYIMAYKSDESGAETSDVEKLYKIDLYKVLVEKTSPTQVSINGKLHNVSDLLDGKGSDIVLSKKFEDWELIGSFIMPQTAEKSLMEFATEAAKSIDNGVEQTFKQFKTLLDDLRELKTLTQDYATEPTIDKGSATLEKSEKFDTNLKALGSSYGQTLSETIQKEQKITANFLKKLIEESFKK